MHVVEVWNQKGGVGKSTLALQLAGAMTKGGLRVLLVDLDPQKSCKTFYDNCRKPVFNVVDKLPESKPEDYDIMLIDHSPERSIDNDPLDIADIVIVPTLASVVDILATVPALDALKKRKPGIKTMVVLNRFVKNRELSKEVLRGFRYDAIIAERSIYSRTYANFCTVHNVAGLSAYAYGVADAKNEIDDLTRKIGERLNDK